MYRDTLASISVVCKVAFRLSALQCFILTSTAAVPGDEHPSHPKEAPGVVERGQVTYAICLRARYLLSGTVLPGCGTDVCYTVVLDHRTHVRLYCGTDHCAASIL